MGGGCCLGVPSSRFSAIVMFERSSLIGAQFGDPALLSEDPAGTAPNGWYRSAWVNYTGDGKPSVTFQDADLTSASATYPEFRNARFTGATLSSFVSQAQAQQLALGGQGGLPLLDVRQRHLPARSGAGRARRRRARALARENRPTLGGPRR